MTTSQKFPSLVALVDSGHPAESAVVPGLGLGGAVGLDQVLADPDGRFDGDRVAEAEEGAEGGVFVAQRQLLVIRPDHVVEVLFILKSGTQFAFRIVSFTGFVLLIRGKLLKLWPPLVNQRL